MYQKTPIYGKDYMPGTTGFSMYDASALSKGISWLQSFEEAVSFIEEIREQTYSPRFEQTHLKQAPSHVFKVVDKLSGIESEEKGVEYFDLQERINDPHLRIVFREPQRLNIKAITQMLYYAGQLEKKEKPYDYTGLVGSIIRIFSPLNKIFPIINRLPNPLSIGGLYCSAFDADTLKHTDEYRKEKIFKKFHVTRIDPMIHWYMFPWKPLKMRNEIQEMEGFYAL